MDLNAACKFLTSRGWLSRLPSDVQEYWLEGAQFRQLSRGETLFNVDDNAHYMFGIAEGVVGAYLSYNPEEARLMMLVCEGLWAGDPTVMSAEKRRGTAIARSNCTLLIVPKDHVEAVSDRFPEIWRWISANLVIQFDSFTMLSAAAHHRNPTVRVIVTLLSLIKLNVGHDTFDISAEEIGHMAGLTRNTVAKCLAELEQLDLVERAYASVRIKSIPALAAAMKSKVSSWTAAN